MLAEKATLKLVRAQHFTHEKIIAGIVAKFYGAPCQFSSLTNDGLVGIQQARQLDWNLFPTARRTLNMRSLGHVGSHRDAHAAEKQNTLGDPMHLRHILQETCTRSEIPVP